jgi:hypothetical protein
MTSRRTAEAGKGDRDALIWIDHRQALIMGREDYDRRRVQVLERGPMETETGFECRVVDEVVDDQRVTVTGPVDARTQFERAYVGMTRRPDRLVDVERTEPAWPARGSS